MTADAHGIDRIPEVKSSQQLAEEFGVSSSTIERVRTSLDQATPEQIQSMRDRSEAGEKPGVRTMYEQVQQDKLKSKLDGSQQHAHTAYINAGL